MLHSFSVLFLLLPLLLFCSLFLFSPAEAVDDAYTLPYEHFINCGSKSNATFGIRNFTQDQNSGPFSGKGSKPVKDTKPSADTPMLYQTARIFGRPYPYKFKISQKGTYLVRLHFFAFTSSVSLADAVFDVSAQPTASAPWLLLLSNFTMKNSNESSVIKEFLLTVGAGKFEIYFIPSQISRLAFVNAIEVFLAPTGFIPDNATRINFLGIKGNYHGLLSNVLQKIYRINVGGSDITAKTDTLMRYWIPDDQFLVFPGSAENWHRQYVKLEYEQGANGSTKFIAPEDVYRTAKKLTSGQTNFSNITWRFKVNEHARHFVRAHFCDLISPSLHYPGLNLCINGIFCQLISPFEIVKRLAAPFYADFVVDSGKSGNIDVSVGPYSNTDQTAFLNGLEIMQLMENSYSSFVPPKRKKKILVIIAGSLGLAFAFIIIVVVLVCLVCLKGDPGKIQRLPSSLALLGGWSKEEVNLADWGLLWLKKGQLEKIIDPVLVDKINPDSLRKFGELAEKCLEAKGTKRPTMHEVLWDLEYALSLHTGISTEQPDESITNSSLQFGPPVLLDVPTCSFLIEENEQSIVGNHGSDTSASEVFSQLKFAGAR
ncbi:hypothetical protein QUC31_003174 [Theobroma cacao]